VGRRMVEAGPWTLFGDCEVVGVVVDEAVVPATGKACVVRWVVGDVTFTASAVRAVDGYVLDYNGHQVVDDDVALVGAIIRWRRVAARG